MKRNNLHTGSTLIMGILNINDDSFFAGSRAKSLDAALNRTAEMIEAGADILDIGAESTRPGSAGLDDDTELELLMPVVEAVRSVFPSITISIDTRKATVAKAAIGAGVDIINDVSGLELEDERDAMAELIAGSNASYVLMHTMGTPDTMHLSPHYDDFRSELAKFFEEKIAWLESKGVKREKIIIDPGVGFAKRIEDNLSILANIPDLKKFDLPTLIGASRKGFIGKLSAASPGLPALPPENRLPGTLAVTALCAMESVDIVRVHDVAENVAVVRTIRAIREHTYA